MGEDWKFNWSPEEVAADNFGDIWNSRPPSPVGHAAIEVCVVGRRCVYLNNYRLAGGKPYISENLPEHTLKTSLREVLDSFPEEKVLAALAERKAEREFIKAYHDARKEAVLAQEQS